MDTTVGSMSTPNLTSTVGNGNSVSAVDRPGSSSSTILGSTSKPTADALRKQIRTKRKETDLRRMLHSYDLTMAPPERVKRLAQVFDDIGTRSSCPTHLIYSPKPVPRKKQKSRVPISKHDNSTTSTINQKDFAKDRAAYEMRLEKERRDFAEKIEHTKDAIETDLEDIDFLKQQMQAQKERIASHQNAPRAQEREAEAGMILPVTGYNNASVLNKRMVEKSLAQLTKRIMQKRAEGNDAIGENMKIKYVIDNLRRERTTFIKIFRNMNEELTEIKRQIAEDEEFVQTANSDRADLHNEIRNAQQTRDEMRSDAERDLTELEQKRLDELRLEKLAKEAEEEKRRKERNRKRAEAKAARNRAREEHQKQHDAHMAASKTRGLLGSTESVESGGSSILPGTGPSVVGGSSILDSQSALSGFGSQSIGIMESVGKDGSEQGRKAMEEIYNEWSEVWDRLLEGTVIRKQRPYDAGGKTKDVSSDRLGIQLHTKSADGFGSGNQPPSMQGAAAEEKRLRTSLVNELRTNADASFSQMQTLNDMKNKRDALQSSIRDMQVEMRQLERARKESGGADDNDRGSVSFAMGEIVQKQLECTISLQI